MSKKGQADLPLNAEAEMAEVRLLSDCEYGSANDIALVPKAVVPQLKAAFRVDDDPSAVDYARTLPQNAPKGEEE